jgi:photosystem II stability/assembly factor-like uncharacterized protein
MSIYYRRRQALRALISGFRRRGRSRFDRLAPRAEFLERRRLLTLNVGSEPGLNAFAGVGFALHPVASISDTVNGVADNTPGDYQVQIDWGDGTAMDSSARLVAVGNNVLVKGSHIYQSPNNRYTVTVHVTGPGGQTASAQTTSVDVTLLPDPASRPPDTPASFPGAEPLGSVTLDVGSEPGLNAFAGVGFALNPVALISGSYEGAVDNTTSDYRVQINWGDSTHWDTNVGLSASGNSVLAKGTHIYQATGNYAVTAYVTGPDGQTNCVTTSLINVTLLPDTASRPPDVPTSYSGARPQGDVTLDVGTEPGFNAYAGISTGENPIALISGFYNGPLDNHVGDYKAQINWGDSPQWDQDTTLTVSGNSVLVSGAHTFEAAGDYDVTVYVTGPDGQTNCITTTSVRVSALLISPSPQTINATEGTAYSNSVASFTVNDPAAQASDFTASVDWGDGTTTTGTVAANSSSGFTVDGTHTYADEMTSVPVNVTIDTANTGIAVAVIHPLTSSPNAVTVTSTANVQEADTILFGNVMTIAVLAGVPYQGVVATFTDSGYPSNMPGDFTGMIDWGDGTTTPGTVSGGNGTFMLSAQKTDLHAYASTGTFTLKATVNDDKPGTTLGTGTETVHVVNTPLAATGTTINVTEGNTFNGTVASFTDSDPTEPAGNFTAMITWDDGTTSAGTISGSNGLFTVSGSHLYPEEKTALPISVSIKDTVTSATAMASSTAIVADAPLTASGTSLGSIVEGNTFTGTVATFTDAYAAEPDGARDFTAMINWGDTMTSAGMITGSNGHYTVTGLHPYKDEKASYPVVVTITDDGGMTATATSTIAVTDAPLTAAGTTVNTTEGNAFTGTVATFTDAYPAEPDGAADFTATIDWGDTMTSAGMITGSNGQYTVTGTHTYAEETVNPRPVTVTITDDGGMSATAHTTASVADAALTATGTTITSTPGTPFTGTVATFTDADPAEPDGARDFTAMIDWGDGVTSAGTVGGSNGQYTVTGTHTYFYTCAMALMVSIRDDGGQSATASTNVNFPGVTPLPPASTVPANSAAPTPNAGTWQAVGPAPIATGRTQTPGDLAVSGRITGIATSPSDPWTMYVATAGGGVWKTTDGGTTWNPLPFVDANGNPLTDAHGNPVPLFMGAIAIAPTNPSVIYAGTGESDNTMTSFYGVGVLVSTNAGASWRVSDGGGAFYRRTISKIVVDPSDPTGNTVYVAVSGNGANGLPVSGNTGIWKSTNGGIKWDNTTSSISMTDSFSDLIINPANPQMLYAAVGQYNGDAANGVYVTTTGGERTPTGDAPWSLAGNFPGGDIDGRITLAMAPSNPQILYASIVDPATQGQGVRAIERSPDGGTTWIALTSADNFNYQASMGYFDSGLAVSPMNPNLLFAAGTPLSGPMGPTNNQGFLVGAVTDPVTGASSWKDIGDGSVGKVGPHADNHALVFNSACQLLAGDDGGLFMLSGIDNLTVINTDTGPSINIASLSWTDLNGNLGTIQFDSVAFNPAPSSASPAIVFGGSQDNGIDVYTGMQEWNETDTGDGGQVQVAPGNTQIVYHVDGQSGDLFRSTNGGNTFPKDITPQPANVMTAPQPPLPANDPRLNLHSFAPFTLDPSDPSGQSLLYGTTALFESLDGGAHWRIIGDPLTPGTKFNPESNNIDAIAVAPSDSRMIYVAARGLVFVTTDDGGTWAQAAAQAINKSGTLALMYDSIAAIAIDPSDPMTAYAVRNRFNIAANPANIQPGSDLRLMSWGDGSGVPTSGTNLVIVGIDNNGLLHIRIFDADGSLVTDTDETKLSSTQAGAIATLKQQLPGLLPPHVLTSVEKAQVLSEVTSIVGQPAFTGHVFETNDRGKHWTDLGTDNGLPDFPAWSILIDPRVTPARLFVGTDIGVYASTDGGNTWAPYMTGLPNVQVRSLALNTTTNTLAAGTFGRGLWEIHLAATPAALQFSSAQFTANVTDGSTPIVLTRNGDLSGTDTVVVSSPGGGTVAAFNQTISFVPGAMTATLTLPIPNDGNPGEADVHIPLTLSSPSSGATLGATTSADLVIHDNNPPVTVAPAVLQFSSTQFTANITDGSTQIVLTRTGNLSAAVTLVVSSPGGPDLAAFQQTITFAANAASATVTLPIQNDGKPGAADVAIPLSLSSPSPGATLGAATTATLVVHDTNSFPPLVTVTSLQPTTVRLTTGTGKKGKTKTAPGLLLQFSGNLSGTGNPAAYQLQTGTTRKGKTTFNKNVPLTVFNATPTTVTLVPAGKLKLSQAEQLRVTASDLSDAFGRPLDGGQSFTATFGNKVVTSARVKNQSRIGPLSVSAVDALFEQRLIGSVRSARRGPVRGD